MNTHTNTPTHTHTHTPCLKNENTLHSEGQQEKVNWEDSFSSSGLGVSESNPKKRLVAITLEKKEEMLVEGKKVLYGGT